MNTCYVIIARYIYYTQLSLTCILSLLLYYYLVVISLGRPCDDFVGIFLWPTDEQMQFVFRTGTTVAGSLRGCYSSIAALFSFCTMSKTLNNCIVVFEYCIAG